MGLRNFMDKKGKYFAERGKFEKMYPLFEAADSFLFTPGKVTRKASHVRDAMDLKRVMILVVYALLPCVFMAIYNTGLQANLELGKMGMESLEGWRGMLLNAMGAGLSPYSITD